MATPPPRHRRPTPELFDELIEEILIRLARYKPELLIRCSAVCKPWRRLLTGPAFLRRYRVFHGAPPMPGFLINVELPDYSVFARFVLATSFRPLTTDHDDWCAHDSRHGRVLFHDPRSPHPEFPDPEILVWDPVTGARWELPLPPVPCCYWVTAVLCAAAAREGGGDCDHLDCHGGPFLVAFLGTTLGGLTFVCVYSSEAAAWGDATYAEGEHPDALDDMDMRPNALVSNTIYFISSQSKAIVGYDLGHRQLAFIDPPFAAEGYAFLMPLVGQAGVRWREWDLPVPVIEGGRSRRNRGMDATQSHRAQRTAHWWAGWLRGGPGHHLRQDTCWGLRDCPQVRPCHEGVHQEKCRHRHSLQELLHSRKSLVQALYSSYAHA